jgi:hypothetical protein
MVRLLLIGVIPIAITAAIIFFIVSRPGVKNDRPKSFVEQITTPFSGSSDEPTTTYEDLTDETKITRADLERILEASMAAVNARIDVLAGKQGVSVPPVSAVNLTPTPAPVAAITTSGPKVVYIPLGSSGSSTSLSDYASLATTETVIDTADYPGYKNMYLEADFRIYQGNGTGYGRLSNKTDGLTMVGSDVSTTSENYGVKRSGAFRITAGKKTYVVQLKSATGYSVDLQAARIRVEF